MNSGVTVTRFKAADKCEKVLIHDCIHDESIIINASSVPSLVEQLKFISD